MCSIVSLGSGGGGDSCNDNSSVGHEFDIFIPEFWSRREEWSPGCCIGTNIKLGQYSCQLQVFPTGDKGAHKEKSEASSSVVEILRLNQIMMSSMSTPVAFGVVLINTSETDLIFDGLCSIDEMGRSIESETLPKYGKLELFNLSSEASDDLHLKRGGKHKNNIDLKIFLRLFAKLVPLENEEYHEDNSLRSAKSSLSEIRELESIEDKLSETTLCQEVSKLKKDVGQLNVELTDQKTKLSEHEQLLKGNLPELILKEVSATIKEKMSVVEESNKWAQKQGTYITSNIRQTKEEILHAVGFLKTSLGGGEESKSLAAISQVQLQLEMLQDSVLTAVSSPPPVFKPVYPECPYCMEEFSPPAQILQVTAVVKTNTSLAAPGALTHRLQHLPAHFIQNGRWGPGIGQTLGYWTLRSTFAK